jgi:Domain of unknown function (DUF4124)
MDSIKMCELTTKINIILIMLIVSPVSVAEMYKWVDENGETHYSQNPPVEDVQVETIAPPPRVNSEDANQSLSKTKEKADSLREERLTAKENKEKEKMEAQQLKEQCQQLKQRLTSLQVRPRANKKDENGNLVRMTEEERQSDIEKTEKDIKDKCN